LRRALLLLTVVILLILGGYLSTSLSKQGADAVPGIKVQTENPEASVFTVTPDKGAIFFIFVAIALGSVVGMGVTLAIVFSLLNNQVEKAKATDVPKPATSNAQGADSGS
jgi:hypothetical protein